MMPNGWSKKRISDILDRVVVPVKPEVGTYYREIGIRSHGKGIFHKEKVTSSEIGNKRVFEVIENAFVVNIVFAWEQAIAKISEKEHGFIASHRFPQFFPKKGKCDIDYLVYFFKTPKGKYLLGLASPGGAGRNKTLGQKEFDRLELNLPPCSEQRKIAQILSTWDKAIATTEKLIDASKQQKKSLMQQLLTGKKRLVDPETGKAFEGDWEKGVIADYISFSGGAQPPRATFIDHYKDGYIRLIQIRDYKSDKFLTYIPIEKAKKRCKIDDVMIGRYGPPIFQILRGIEGAYNVALIKAIPCVKIDKEFMFFFLSIEPLFEYIESFSRRTSGQTGIEMDRLKEYPLHLPTLKEQQKIASVLTAADKEIELLVAKLAHLKQEKKALMQQLLTGKRRVQVEAA
ncbi:MULTISPECIES: restriction endonuclease subunit S [Aliivibrio]|uniref:Restriction endonuclease subunit S n=1 Tax=Aliivibrio finisterrensis TaxID=511998 RepID=A0A4Q5KTP0_9GAMM|nr:MULTISPECIES: restriction endonuclease subunit S [Aliivibrio]MDD9177632.1 restriction endonuclease subunit S [Aliivibrio sp. A6]RYU51244.1 restriction endonuclease subunit S [Aliivibrio finisterrensis]RYU54441.1 restriction endonuclease subunit S [Aliivibrio finisterrensis]RYU59510.1 restriction endonuclease subunit S [Aliivibrio finisterrensis]RYU65477.1 restriction endonuclease subunit S [Aliivibrio finisterrensis]